MKSIIAPRIRGVSGETGGHVITSSQSYHVTCRGQSTFTRAKRRTPSYRSPIPSTATVVMNTEMAVVLYKPAITHHINTRIFYIHASNQAYNLLEAVVEHSGVDMRCNSWVVQHHCHFCIHHYSSSRRNR